MLASRAYSREDEKKMNLTFARHAGHQTQQSQTTSGATTKYRVAQSMVPFEGRDDVKRADKVVADKLKEIFQPHLPKYEDVDGEMAED